MNFKWFTKLSPILQTAIVIVVVVLLFLAYRKIKSLLNKPKHHKVDWDDIPVVGKHPNPNNPNENVQTFWDPDPLASEISENLEGYNFATYPDTAQKILDLQTDDQVKLLYNHYNDHYATDYPTLTQLFENEWSDWGGTYAKVVSRLKGLGLN